MMQHCPKKHLDFENPIKNPNTVDTWARINGAKEWNETTTEASGIGAGSNPVDSMPKIGLRKKGVEAEVSNREHLNG